MTGLIWPLLYPVIYIHMVFIANWNKGKHKQTSEKMENEN